MHRVPRLGAQLLLTAVALVLSGSAAARTAAVRCTATTEIRMDFAPYNGIGVDGGYVSVPRNAYDITQPGDLVDTTTGKPPAADALPRQSWQGFVYEGRPTAADPKPSGAPDDAWIITIDVHGSGRPPQPTGAPPTWRWSVSYSIPGSTCPSTATPAAKPIATTPTPKTVPPELLDGVQKMNDELAKLEQDEAGLSPEQLALKIAALDHFLYDSPKITGNEFRALNDMSGAADVLEQARRLPPHSTKQLLIHLEAVRGLIELAIEHLDQPDTAAAKDGLRAVIAKIDDDRDRIASDELTPIGIAADLQRLVDASVGNRHEKGALETFPHVFGFEADDLYQPIHALGSDLDQALSTSATITRDEAHTLLEQAIRDGAKLELALRRGPPKDGDE